MPRGPASAPVCGFSNRRNCLPVNACQSGLGQSLTFMEETMKTMEV